MIPWWGAVLIFIAGWVFGAFLLALCIAGQSEAERRWKNEQRTDRHK